MDEIKYMNWFKNLEKNDLVAIEIKENEHYVIAKVDDIRSYPNEGIFEVFTHGDRTYGRKYVDGKFVDHEHPSLNWKMLPITANIIEHTKDLFYLESHLNFINYNDLTLEQLQDVYKILISKSGNLRRITGY